jgi:hypothetical protein
VECHLVVLEDDPLAQYVRLGGLAAREQIPRTLDQLRIVLHILRLVVGHDEDRPHCETYATDQKPSGHGSLLCDSHLESYPTLERRVECHFFSRLNSLRMSLPP